MNLRTFRLYLCAFALLVCGLGTAADLVILDLRNRTAEEVLPVLRPMAGSASLSGTGYKLFVRGEAAEVARIREVLAALDRK